MQVDFLAPDGTVHASVYVIPAWAVEGKPRDPA